MKFVRLIAAGVAVVACLGHASVIAQQGRVAPKSEIVKEDPIPELLAGVSDVAAPGVPSPLCVWNSDATVVICGGGEQGMKAPAVVAGHAGAGRFVALPHDGYFGEGVLAKGQTGRFLVNATRWAAGPKNPKPKVAARGQELVDRLNAAGCDAHLLGAVPLAEELVQVDVVIGLTSDLADADLEPLERFTYRGGGIIAGQCAWGWLQVTGAPSLDANPLNRFFARFGVAWADGYLGPLGEVGFKAERAPPKLTHGNDAVVYLVHHQDPTNLEKERPMLQAAATATALVRMLPLDDRFIRPLLLENEEKLASALLPSPEQPLVQTDGIRRVLLALALSDAARVAPGKCAPLACAKLFPGEVPADAPRVTRSVAIDTAVPRWHSTGLYAAPGEAITVRLPKPAADASAPASGGLVLQIGAHSDELWGIEEWERAPKVVRRIALDRELTTVASPLGGLIYVDVPEGCRLGQLAVEIGRVVEAPRFVLERTTNDEWKGALRQLPAPWAELESGKIIVTVPSPGIRALDDPEALMRLWDRCADAAADLVALPRARQSPERFVADVQIAAGYMHSGYPIMTHLDAAKVLADPALLARGDWGLLHELGHNHQVDDWTFDGVGEVTNNVICLYLLETVCGRKLAEGGELFHGVTGGAKEMAPYFAAGARFETWKQQPFLALQLYVQVQQAFGWQVYRDVFDAYRKLPRSDAPKDDAAKRDLWLVMLSRACKRNLGPFFTAWGVPTSDAARASVASLAEWMPADFPPH